MTLRSDLPAVAGLARPKAYQTEVPGDALADWSKKPLAEAEAETEISIYDVIGEDWWSGNGWTGDRMRRALKRANGRDVTVKINSPGGDVFEGLAIYNELRSYKGKVSVQVMGIAASAASFIAMAADDLTMGLGTMMMVHKAWGIVIGNEDEFADAAEVFGKIDASMVEVYRARTGKTADELSALLRATTWMTAQEAVDQGFADRVDSDLVAEEAKDAKQNNSALMARRAIEAALARDGFTRQDRTALLRDLVPSAAPLDASGPLAERDAGIEPGELASFLAEAKAFVTKIHS